MNTSDEMYNIIQKPPTARLGVFCAIVFLSKKDTIIEMKRTQKYLKRFFRVLSLGLIIGVLYFLVYNNSYEAYSFTPSESKVLRDGKTYLDAM